MTAIIALSMIVGYAGCLVGIPPVAMFAIVSSAALVGEYARRITLHYYRRQTKEATP